MTSHTRYRVLVVDDEEANRTLAHRILTNAGYDVDVAEDATVALKMLEERGTFDLFVLDVMMPGMQGTELAARVRLQQPDAKVLFFTAYSERLFQGKRVLGENEAFLQKPVGVRELAEAASLILFSHLNGPSGNATPK